MDFPDSIPCPRCGARAGERCWPTEEFLLALGRTDVTQQAAGFHEAGSDWDRLAMASMNSVADRQIDALNRNTAALMRESQDEQDTKRRNAEGIPPLTGS